MKLTIRFRGKEHTVSVNGDNVSVDGEEFKVSLQ